MAEVKVTLVSWTQNPLETLWAIWEASKTEKPLDECWPNGVPKSEVELLFERVIAQDIPVSEHLHFVFMMENVSIEWREQAVRHRVGVRIGPLMGVDLAPDLAESSWWSQSMRIMDMSLFADGGHYRVPETLAGKVVDGAPADQVWAEDMKRIQAMYAKYVNAGLPMEDARGLIPLAAHHRISWVLNLHTIQHIVGKRGCWILQLGLWRPVIEGMVNELATKVHPAFRNLITPPCLKGDDFKGCVFMEENRRRVTGDDSLPVCSLYAHNHMTPESVAEVPMKAAMLARAEEYRAFWGRDPYTGVRFGR